jgi:putative ATPase
MLQAGDDIRFIARRLVIFASEDIGNADPRAITLAVNAMQAVEMIGMPEAKLILAQAVTYCATAPKSNSSCLAINQAMEDIEKEQVQPIPLYLRDPHSATGKAGGETAAYLYPHSYKEHFVNQDYLGVGKKYYQPGEAGYEKKIKERLGYWNSLRSAR